jgi:hypothetical protein
LGRTRAFIALATTWLSRPPGCHAHPVGAKKKFETKNRLFAEMSQDQNRRDIWWDGFGTSSTESMAMCNNLEHHVSWRVSKCRQNCSTQMSNSFDHSWQLPTWVRFPPMVLGDSQVWNVRLG